MTNNDVLFGQQEIRGLLFPEPTQIKNGFDYNAYVASLPIKNRYLVHCLCKGWTPSMRGLRCFIRLLRLGYYKTL